MHLLRYLPDGLPGLRHHRRPQEKGNVLGYGTSGRTPAAGVFPFWGARLPPDVTGHNLDIMIHLVIWRKCLLCRKGFLRGLDLCGHLLCASCESRLVNLSCDDPEYDAVRQGLKKVWRARMTRLRPPAARRVASLRRAW